MTILQTSRQVAPASGSDRVRPWRRVWDWVARPLRYGAVTRFRSALDAGDAALLAELLHPDVSVVTESGDPEHPTRRVVVGTYDAVPLLVHGLGRQNGLSIDVRSVNGQAGIILTDRGRSTATMAVDFTGNRITMLWLRLQPYQLRHWNRV
jgi:hypothetical protein